jgi:hypothetical protein
MKPTRETSEDPNILPAAANIILLFIKAQVDPRFNRSQLKLVNVSPTSILLKSNIICQYIYIYIYI